MKLRKKALVSTLSVTMATAMLAGIPLNISGNPVGAIQASAAAQSNLDLVKNKLDKIYGKLSLEDKQKLAALKSEINTKITKTEFLAIFNDILAKTTAAGVENDTVFSLFQAVSSLTYDPSYQNLIDIRNNQSYIDAAKQLGQAGEVDDLSVDDLVMFVFGPSGVEETLVNIVKTKSLTELLLLVEDGEARNNLLRSAYTQTLENTEIKGVKLSLVMDKLGITEDMVASAVLQTQSKLNPQVVKSATLALARAYIAAEGITLPGANPGDGGNGNGGGAGGGGGGGAAGGGGGATAPATPTTPTTGPLDTLTSIDSSKLVKIADGVATLELKEADVLKTLEAIKSAAAGQTGLALTLDLGEVKADAIDVPVSKAIVEAAKAAGIDQLVIAVNGLTLTLPLDSFTDSLNLSVAKKEDSLVTSISPLQLASDVYEFGLESGGEEVTSFGKPVTVRIPLRDLQSVDEELLSLAKIVNGTLQFQGGSVEGEYLVEPRDSFSSYAVVENKVAFNDIQAVQDWAGRQIQVVAAKGAIEGKSAGVFAPQDKVTRAEFAKMLIRALNLENSLAAESFGDVSTNDWFAPYVAAAVQQGIIQGRSADAFAPYEQISRAEMATMISRALKAVHQLKDSGQDLTVLNQFNDASEISPSLEQGVAFAASNKLVIGNNGEFNPNDNATRAEAAVIIYRTMNFKAE